MHFVFINFCFSNDNSKKELLMKILPSKPFKIPNIIKRKIKKKPYKILLLNIYI